MKMIQSVFGRPREENETRVHRERHPKPIDGGPFFVLAPEGFGNSGYIRFGEVDVLDAIEQVVRRYRIDDDRVYVTGNSMGGIGAASLPLHYPDRFAAAAPLCGYHSQFVRTGLRGMTFKPWELFLLESRSNAAWAENGRYLPLYLVHGRKDSPMHSRVLAERYRQLRYKVTFEIPDLGHNVWDEAYSRRRIFKYFKPFKRVSSPEQVTFRTASLRYRTSYWMAIDDVDDHNGWAGVDAASGEDGSLRVTTENVRAFTVSKKGLPDKGAVESFVVDGQNLVAGEPEGDGWRFYKNGNEWKRGKPGPCADLCKRPGLAGPLRDAEFEPLLFVYGTSDKSEERLARRLIAEMKRPRPGTTIDWPVKADYEVTERDIADRSLVLVGTPSGHRLLGRIAGDLPIRVDGETIVAGKNRYRGKAPAASFIYPNPLNPKRYVVVHTGVSLEALYHVAHLPDIIPDYIVYDGPDWQWKRGKVLGEREVLAADFFDRRWQFKTRSDPKAPGR